MFLSWIDSFSLTDAASLVFSDVTKTEHLLELGKVLKGMPVKLLIADDHPLIREALTDTFASLRETFDISAVADGERLLTALSAQPDTALVLLDLFMPGPNGFELLAAIRERFAEVKVVVLTSSEDPGDLRTAVKLGAAGYVLKSEPSNELISVVHRVLAGGVSFPEVMADLEHTDDPQAAMEGAELPLTDRQVEVLQLIAEGLSNKEIARRLGLSENTVKIHVSAVFRVLGVHNRTQAAVVARQKGVLKGQTAMEQPGKGRAEQDVPEV